MEEVKIAGIDTVTMDRLRTRALLNGRTLEGELCAIVEEAVGHGWSSVSTEMERIRAKFSTRSFTNSEDLRKENETL